MRRVLDGVTEELRGLLMHAVVLGDEFTPEDLAVIAGEPVPRVLGALASAAVEGWVTVALDPTADRGVVSVDPTLARVLRDVLPPSLLCAARANAARSLAAAGRPPARWSAMLALAARPGPDAVADARLLREAARALLAGEPDGACKLLERALEIVPATEPSRFELTAELVTALAWANRGPEAVETASRLLPSMARAEDRGALVVALVRAMVLTGAVGPATVALIDRERNSLPSEVVSQVDVLWAQGVAGTEPRAAHRVARRLRHHGSTVVRAQAAVALSAVGERTMRVRHAIRWGQVALRESMGLDPAAGHSDTPAHLSLGVALTQADRFDEARDVLAEGLRISTALGVEAQCVAYHGWLGRLHHHAGHWDEAVAEINKGFACLQRLPTGGHFDHSLLVRIAVARNEPAAAAASLAEIERSARRAGIDTSATWAGLIVLATTDPARAAATVKPILRRALDQEVLAVFRSGNDAMDVARRTGDAELADIVLRLVAAAAGAARTDSAAGMSIHLHGAWAGDPDQIAEGVARLRAGPRRDDLHAALADLAMVSAASGRREDALGAAREAIDFYDSVSAAILRRRVVDGLAGHGIRMRRPPRRPGAAVDTLTPTERLVVDLVGRGLSNPAIGHRLGISPRTVATHLTNVYRKLGVRSRSELAARVASEAWPPPTFASR